MFSKGCGTQYNEAPWWRARSGRTPPGLGAWASLALPLGHVSLGESRKAQAPFSCSIFKMTGLNMVVSEVHSNPKIQ